MIRYQETSQLVKWLSSHESIIDLEIQFETDLDEYAARKHNRTNYSLDSDVDAIAEDVVDTTLKEFLRSWIPKHVIATSLLLLNELVEEDFIRIPK